MSDKAPISVAYLRQLATLKIARGWTYEDIRTRLNEYLTTRKIESRNGRSQIERWLHTTRKGWVQPRGDVMLAIQQLLQNNS